MDHMHNISEILRALKMMVSSPKEGNSLEHGSSEEILYGLTMLLSSANGKLGEDEGFRTQVIEEDLDELANIVQVLKKLDTSLRDVHSPPPGKEVQILYGLILGVVYSEIFLFQREEFSWLLEDLVNGGLIKELRKTVLKFGETLAETNFHIVEKCVFSDFYDPHGSCVLREFRTRRKIFIKFIELFLECMESLPKTKISATKDDGEDVKTDTSTKASLQQILFVLDNMRRRRAYAPPTCQEIKFYRLIRESISATQDFIFAKQECQKRLLAVDLSCEVLGGGRWFSTFSAVQFCDGFRVFSAPPGHNLALIYDEFPQILNRLRRCKKSLGAIMSSFYGNKGSCLDDDTSREEDIDADINDVNGIEGSCVDNTEIGLRNEVYMPSELEARKKAKHEKVIATGASASRNWGVPTGSSSKTREDHLINILQILRGIKSLCWQSLFSHKEVRLYTQIMEHVRLSLWTYDAVTTPVGKMKTREIDWNSSCWPEDTHHATLTDEDHQQKGYSRLACSDHSASLGEPSIQDDFSRTPLSDVEGSEIGKTREEYLEEIVSLVEGIKSLHLYGTAPTKHEFNIYFEIQRQMNDVCMQARCYWDPEVEKEGLAEVDIPSSELNLLKYMLRSTYSEQLMLFEKLEAEVYDILHMVFNELPEPYDYEWLEMHRAEIVNNMATKVLELSQGRELLGHALMTLEEVGTVASHLCTRLFWITSKLDTFLETQNEGHLQSLLCEACTSLFVLRKSSSCSAE